LHGSHLYLCSCTELHRHIIPYIVNANKHNFPWTNLFESLVVRPDSSVSSSNLLGYTSTLLMFDGIVSVSLIPAYGVAYGVITVMFV
jgi:hypothetical protein